MSPFKSLKQAAIAVVGSFLAGLLAERLDNADMLKDVTAPVFIVHGKSDELIPYEQSQALIEYATRSRFTQLWLPLEMTHNRFNLEEDLVKPLLKFLAQARLDLACRMPQKNGVLLLTSEHGENSKINPAFLISSSLKVQIGREQPKVKLLHGDESRQENSNIINTFDNNNNNITSNSD